MAAPIAVALEQATMTFRLSQGCAYTAVEKAELKAALGEFVAIVGKRLLREFQ